MNTDHQNKKPQLPELPRSIQERPIVLHSQPLRNRRNPFLVLHLHSLALHPDLPEDEGIYLFLGFTDKKLICI